MMHVPLLLTALLTANVSPAHAFDYQFGAWRVHVSRLLDAGGASPHWARYSGTHVVTPLLGGAANVGVLEVTGPAGRIEGLQLRTYDAPADQWRLSFASGSDGVVQPPSVGGFASGQGLFFNSERIAGRPARVRTVVNRIAENAYRDVISYSTDGRAWHPFWIASYVKMSGDEHVDTSSSSSASNRDFDFQIGRWHAEMRRLANRLSGSHDWRTYTGSLVLRRLWNGRANVGELDVRNGPDHIESIILRTYDPQTRQWSDYSVAMPDASVLFPPAVGRFSNGRGELYDRDTYDGKAVVVRYLFDDITARTCRFVQSFSADDGKTWEPNAVVLFTRA